MAGSTHVLVIGAASIDVKAQPCQSLQPGTSTPGNVKISIGGVARNIAENLARLGQPTVLLSAVGDDRFGRHICDVTAAAGVDTSHVLYTAGAQTGTYVAVLDQDGRPHISIADMDIMASLTPQYVQRHRRLFKNAAMVVLDGNVPPRTIHFVFNAAQKAGVPICVDPTSVALAGRFVPYLKRITLMTPNAAEAEVFCGEPVGRRREAIRASRCLVSMGVQQAIITLGPDGLAYATAAESGWVPALEVEVVDLTGAGDALTAGVVFGLLNDMPLDEAVRLGVSAAALTLGTRETVHPELSLDLLYERLVI